MAYVKNKNGFEFDSRKNGWNKPLDTILDLKIKYITTDGDCIIIEGKKRN